MHRRAKANKLMKTRCGPAHINGAGGDLRSIFVRKASWVLYDHSHATLSVHFSFLQPLTVCSPLQRKLFYNKTLSITLKANDSRSLWISWNKSFCRLQTDMLPTVACGFNSSGNTKMHVGESEPQEKDVVNTLQLAHHTAILLRSALIKKDRVRRNQSYPKSILIRRRTEEEQNY